MESIQPIKCMGASDFFGDKYWKFSTINTDQDTLKIFNFFVKNAYLTQPPLEKKNLITFTHKSQELKSVKILKMFTHAMHVFYSNVQ